MALKSYVSVLIHCPTHNTVGLRNVNDSKPGLFFPHDVIKETAGVEQTAQQILSTMNPGLDPSHWTQGLELLTMTRIFFDRKEPNPLVHWIFEVRVSNHNKCCQDVSTITWIPLSQLDADHLWGPEVTLHGCIPDLMYEIEPQNLKSKGSIGLDDKKFLAAYQDFYAHCWPSTSMTKTSFLDYLRRVQWKSPFGDVDREFGTRLFNSFLRDGLNYLSFSHFTMGMALTDSEAPHTDEMSSARMTAIFRYYDTGRKGYLTQADVELLNADLLELKKQESGKDTFKPLVTSDMTFPLAAQDLMTLLSEDRLTGTHRLLRRPFDLLSRRLYSGLANHNVVDSCARHQSAKKFEFWENIMRVDDIHARVETISRTRLKSGSH